MYKMGMLGMTQPNAHYLFSADPICLPFTSPLTCMDTATLFMNTPWLWQDNS